MYGAWNTYWPLLISFVIFSCLIWIINQLLYGIWLPPKVVGGVILIIMSYLTILYLCFLVLWIHPSYLYKIFSSLMLILVFMTLFEVLYWVIYIVYPRWGIQLYSPDIPFRPEQFRGRMATNFLGVTIWALACSFIVLYYRIRKQMKESLATVKLLKDRFSSAHIYPHFVESVTATVIGRSLLRNSMGGRRSLEQLAGVMRYVLDRQAEPDQLVSLEEEWKQVNRMAGVVRWMYGKDSMRVRLEGRVDPGLMIIPVSMVLLLENSLKHADMAGEGRIEIRLHGWENGFRLICTNPVDQKGADKAPAAGRAATPDTRAGGFGLQDLERRIERSGLDMGLNIIETDQQFRIELFQRVHQLGTTG
jgi:hypothetical protein